MRGLSSRWALIAYIVALHLVFAGLIVYFLRSRPLLLFACEAAFVLSLWLGFRLVRAFFVPLELIHTGTELLEEREFTTHFRPVGAPEFDRLAGIYNRMADELKEERLRVREQNEFLDRLLEASPGGVVVCDFDGRISEVNPAACRVLEATAAALVGSFPTDHPVLRRWLDLRPGDSRVIGPGAGRQLKGTVGEFRDRGFARRFYLLEELTEELRRGEKEAYGKLIRMISHEVNNSVGPVSSLVESVVAYGHHLPAEDRARFESGLEVASRRLDHLRAFVEGFAEVVKLPPPTRRPCDLEALLADVVLLLEPVFAERRVRCLWERRDGIGEHAVDKNQLEQVFLNVLKNAAEAIGEDGEIRLRTALGAAGEATLEIEDDGHGLEGGAESGLFRPFYTTKQDGRGLGLTLVQEILRNHGIAFSLTDTGSGALFAMRLSRPSSESPPGD